MAGLKKARRVAAKAEAAANADAAKKARQIPLPPWFKSPETSAVPEPANQLGLAMTTGDVGTA